MSTKERIISTIDLMGERELESLLVIIRESFVLKSVTWDDIGDDDPTEDELAAIADFHAGIIV